MKNFKLLFFVLLALISFNVNSQTITTFPYIQDFEGSNFWVSGGTSSSWALGTPAGTTINSAASGSNSWMTNLTTYYNNSENSYVESPYFDFTTLVLPIVEFKLWYNSESSFDGANLEVSIDSGLTWTPVGAVGDPNNWYNNSSVSGLPSSEGWSGSSGGWLTVKHNLTAYAGNASVKFRVNFGSDSSVNSYDGVAFDDFMVYDSPSNDLAMNSYLSPLGGCGASSDDTVTVKIINLGTAAQSNIPVSYSSDGGSTYVNETIAGPLAAGDTLTYTFTTTVDISAVATYNFVVLVANPGDSLNLNDTLFFNVTSMPTINTYPYYQDFEGSQYWISGGTNNNWEIGTPAGTIINSAASGTKAWETGLSSNYANSTEAYVESPCFDFSSLQRPIFEFDFNTNMETCCDEVRLEASVDDGLSWIVIGAYGDPENWYNSTEGWRDDTNGWLHAKHLIDTLANYPNVKLRIYFSSDGSVNYEGFAFDNVLIYDTPHNDLVALSGISPTSGCMLSSNEIVSFNFYNAGLDTIFGNIPVLYSLDGGVTFIPAETCNDTLAPMDTATYTFTTPADLSAVGIYNILAVVDNPGDQIQMNDTISYTVASKPVISTYPYYQNFEGTQYWSQGGVNSSWQLGVPTATIINSAASGTKAWVTNLTGYNNPSEESYVESPCFDFSSLVLPIVELDVNYNSYNSNDGANLQVSIDSGNTWSTIGHFNDPENWYNDNTVSYLIFTGGQEGWTGNSSGWLHAKHSLDTLGGQPSVKFRINFGSSTSTTYEGFGFDNFNVYETPSIDLTVVNYEYPYSNCSLSSTDSITIDILNAGIDTIFGNIPVTYSIDSGATFIASETISDTIYPGDTLTYTFTTPADLSNDQVYNIYAVVSYPTDQLQINDTLTFSVENYTAVVTPYTENFETFVVGTPGTFMNGWVMEHPTTYQWQVDNGGTPSSNTGPTIDHTLGTATGIYIYTEASSGAQGNSTTLTSPCIDLSSMTAPGLSFWYHMYGTAIDTLAVDILDGGVWYNNVYILAGQQQTNQTDPWLKANINLASFPTADKFRFRGIRGNSFEGDIAIDDIQLYELPTKDLAIYNLQTPNSGCGMSNADSLTVTIVNEGAASQSNFDVTYSIDGGSTYITPETITGPLAPGDTIIYTFNTTADFSTYGNYSLIATVNLIGDTINYNDTTYATVNSLPLISTYPYFQDFEGAQYWTSNGVNNNWELGTPAGTIIDSAYSGNNCWETGLSSNYANSTEAYVESPCLDFSSLVQPMFEFYFNTNMESCCDEVRLEASIDGGLTWTVIGAQNDPVNWYNVSQGWSDNTSGWKYAQHALTNLGGQGDVKLRIYLSSDGSVNYEGFAFDNIRIYEAPLNDAGIADITEPTSTCEGTDYVSVKLKNFGYDTLYTCDIDWKVNGTLQTQSSYNGLLVPGADTVITLGTYSFATGLNYTIETYTSNPNGFADDDTTNDYFSEVDTFYSVTPYLDPTVIALQDTICGNWSTATFVASGSNASSYIFWTDSLAGTMVGITADTLTTDTIHQVNTLVTYWVEANDYINDSLITTFAAGNGSNGNMFDVSVNQAATIDSFNINLSSTTSQVVDVYYRLGTYVGHETTAGDWTLLGTTTVTGQGTGNPTSCPIGGLTLSPGQTYGIYIDAHGSIQYTNGATSSTIYTDGIMTIDAGVGLGATFSSVYTPRIWNGIVWYSQGNPCSASNRVPVSVYADSCTVATDIIAFSIPQETGPATINHATKNIHDQVAAGSGLTSLTPTITVSQGATISPASGVTQDFTNSVMYTVTGFDGVTQSVWMVTVTEAAVNVEEIIDGNRISIIPNPSKGLFSVNIYNKKSSTIKLELVSVEGQIISNDKITINNKYTKNYDLSDYAEGVYYLRISTDKSVKVKKIVIE